MALDAAIETIETPEGGMTAIVTLVGMMTLGTNLKTADQKIQSALDQGAKNLVLDMTGVTYSDSAGLGMLVHTYGLIKRNGGEFRVCGVGERVMSMLRMTTTDRMLTLDEDRAASLAALGIDSVSGSA